jgi:hypothetical protein
VTDGGVGASERAARSATDQSISEDIPPTYRRRRHPAPDSGKP